MHPAALARSLLQLPGVLAAAHLPWQQQAAKWALQLYHGRMQREERKGEAWMHLALRGKGLPEKAQRQLQALHPRPLPKLPLLLQPHWLMLACLRDWGVWQE